MTPARAHGARRPRVCSCTWLIALLVAVLAAPASAVAEIAALYRDRCAVCHGSEGRGDGPAAAMLSPRPRDFTAGIYKFRSTPTGALPTAADIAATIGDGLRGTSMPGFRDLLSPVQIDALARHVLAMAPNRAGAGRPLPEPLAPSDTRLERGATLYRELGCGECHGDDGRGGVAVRAAAPGAPTPAADLTMPWTFRRGQTGQVAMRLLTGIDGSAMPSYEGSITPADALAVEAYVRSLARTPAWAARDPAVIARAGVATDPVQRGRYLVNAMLCPLCHTPISAETGAYDTDKFLAGGMRVSAYPWGVWYSRNLTSDAATGLGAWSEADIVAAVTRGLTPDGRRLDPMAMPWPWFSQLAPQDARAVAAYLKALPPNPNAVPAATRPWLVEQVGGKALALLGAETAVEFWGGNAGAERAPRGIPESLGWRALALALGIATLTAAVVSIDLGRRRRWRPMMAAGGLALAGWLALGTWPPVRLMSPETAVRWLLLGSPPLPAALAPAERALATRGAYVAAITPCGLCHTPAGVFVGFYTGRTLAGGMEGRWRVYGSAVSTNLTPHPDGLRGDASVRRALTSGLGHDGRAMHWQAMPWDILSNWSEEDQRALLAYLKTLPPVAGRVPPPRPPRPGDPVADAFYFGDAARR